MENNNNPSTGSGANKNQNVKELTDEQLKQVAGGEQPPISIDSICFPTVGCRKMDPECNCTACEEGFTLIVEGGVTVCA